METFTQTSDGLYDRHYYEVHFMDKGMDPIKFEWYDDARNYWFTHSHYPNLLKYIKIVDKIQKKKGKGGFL